MLTNRQKTIIYYLIPPLVTGLIMLIILYIGDYVPFGTNTMASIDADIQYLDLFAYFKDVLSGRNNISYTFSKTLGGTSVAAFSYYLSSPFSLLVAFFAKNQLELFFNFTVVLKLMMCSLTFCVFLTKRFKVSIADCWKRAAAVILSVSYALCQYTIAQSRNINWLDGVYLLPVLLLFVYEIANGKTSGWKLAVTVGISVLFNWYTAGINCLFMVIWFIVEYALLPSDKRKKTNFGTFFSRFIKFGISAFFGVMISAVLFLPTITALKNGNRGSIDWSLITNPSFNGALLSVIPKYVYGGTSEPYPSRLAVFAGCMAAVGFISVFLSKASSRKTKVTLGVAAVTGLLMVYWNPLFVAFSLFKSATSYWFRYSYLNVFILLFIASYYFLAVVEQDYLQPLKSAAIFAVLLVTFDYLTGTNNWNNVYATAAMSLLIGILLSSLFYHQMIGTTRQYKWAILTICGVLCVVCMLDLAVNTDLLLKSYRASDADSNDAYFEQEEKLISRIREEDRAPYRISQTKTRNQNRAWDNLTANYNESLAFNYWSISGYTSSPDDRQRKFLDHVGYPINGENMNITNTSILAADALLGVKYVLSDYPINGLTKRENLGTANGKSVYENPYVLPMAFIVHGDPDFKNLNTENPFLFQNDVYSRFLGRKVELYRPVPYEIIQSGNGEAVPLIFRIRIPDGNYAVYGNLPSNSAIAAKLSINGSFQSVYAQWMSPSVFYIPYSDATADIELSTAQAYDLNYDKVQFYALDLSLLAEVTKELKSSVPEHTNIQNGAAEITINQAHEGDVLFLSIPKDYGWEIINNGQEISSDTLDGCLDLIKLNEGSNNIVMKYHVPRIKRGAVVTACGLFLTILLMLYETGKIQSIHHRQR